MKRATTIEFRNTARKVLAKHNVLVIDSWTNGAPAKGKVETGTRTVGLQLGFLGGLPGGSTLATTIERELKKLGLSAGTYFSDPNDDSRFRSACYIRATCTYPV